MRLLALPVAGGGGRLVYINPNQVICLMEAGDCRTQVVTTGLQGEASISLIVEATTANVAAQISVDSAPHA